MRKLTAAVLIAALLLMLLAGVLALGISYAAAYLDTDADGYFDPVPTEQVDACPTDPGVAPDGCPPPLPPCDGVQIQPGANLASVAQSNPPGTTFCLGDGTYNITEPIRPESGDRWVGLYVDDSRPVIQTTAAYYVMNASGSDGATVEGLRLTGAVGNNVCEPECGRGIGGGKNLTLIDVRLDHNANQGAGGTNEGLLIRDSLIDNNGSPSFANDGGPVSAAGVKSVNPYTVIDSEVRDNYWDGLWCDIECGEFDISGSTITGNGKAGIHMEISGHTGRESNMTGNTIQRNGLSGRSVYMGGILLVGAENVVVSGNTLGSNLGGVGVLVKMDKRIDDTEDSKDIQVQNNTLNSDTVTGCSISGVTCQNN